MAYVADPDLELLGTCTRDELEPLVGYITHDKDGKLRWAEGLTTHVDYIRHQPDHTRYWQVIASEIQHFAGSTFANAVRGHGVPYREALMNVCDKLGVNYNRRAKTSFIEMSLLQKILTDSIDNMSEDERKQLVTELSLNTTSFTKEAVVASLQIGVKLSGLVAYRMALVVANSLSKVLLGRGLSLAANRTLVRTIGTFAGPVGWAITGVWAAVDIAGPAYRVTIPCVVQIAFLRAQKAQAGGTG